jgi:SNF2 family DNA or RNA helicase
MAAIENNNTPALLLTPHEIFSLFSIFTSLHVVRRDKYMDYDRYPLSEHEIKTHFKQLPTELQQLLSRFNDEDIKFEISQIKKRRAKEKSGIPEHIFVQRATLRYLNESCVQLFEHKESIKVYHRIKNPETGNFRISLCALSTEQPVLHFAISGNDNGSLTLEMLLRIDHIDVNLKDIMRYQFLVAVEEVYYILRHEDWLTLVWLEDKKKELQGYTASELSQKILLKLEERYAVNRNNLFSKTVIKCVPTNTIFLSEIGESYLMFTPRWNYEGFLQEGKWKEFEETTRNGDLYVVYRDQEAEESFFNLLRSLHPNFSKQQNVYCYLSFADAKKKQWFLKVYHQLLELNVEIVGLDMLRHFRYSPYSVHTEMRIDQQEGSTLYLKLTVSFGKEEVALNELQKLLLAKQHSILLKDNSIGVFTEEWLTQYSAIIKHGKIKKNVIAIPQWIMLGMEQGAAKNTLQPIVPKEWREKWMQWQTLAANIYEVPDNINASLRPYQQKGFEWLVLLSEVGSGACLADDMGLGKTLQTICFIGYQQNKGLAKKHLIVCPASLIYNWQKELQKFAPNIKCFIYNGQQRNTKDFFEQEADVLICSYGTLRSDIDELGLIHWNVAVIDESQNIKNTSAQVTKAVYQLQAQNRVALSGTPIMNNTFDLYAQLQFLVPELFGSAEFFRKEYANPIDRDQDKEKIHALQQMTEPFILRRTKKQVATDLPEKTESVLWCEMGDEQKSIYESIKNSIRDSIFLDIKNGGIAKSKLNILQGIQKLRQVCASPQLLRDDEIESEESVKVDVLMDELGSLKGNKALVFSQFKGMLHLIAAKCQEERISYYHFDGDTPIAMRNELVSKFQEEDNDVRVFLISLKSGNAGLTLTAADYVFLVDPWWNNAVQQQAIDRTHRIGQTKSVFAYKMICKDTIEEKIIELQQKKKSLSEDLISEEEGFVKNMTEDDVAYLFG